MATLPEPGETRSPVSKQRTRNATLPVVFYLIWAQKARCVT